MLHTYIHTYVRTYVHTYIHTYITIFNTYDISACADLFAFAASSALQGNLRKYAPALRTKSKSGSSL